MNKNYYYYYNYYYYIPFTVSSSRRLPSAAAAAVAAAVAAATAAAAAAAAAAVAADPAAVADDEGEAPPLVCWPSLLVPEVVYTRPDHAYPSGRHRASPPSARKCWPSMAALLPDQISRDGRLHSHIVSR